MQRHADPSFLRHRAGGNRKPYLNFTVSPEDGEVDVLGKYVSDLQSDVTVSNGYARGTLNYVTDYTGFSGKVEEQKGNYLTLRVDTEDEDDVITVELVGGTVGHPVTLDSDRNIVIRITNPATQTVRVVVTHTNEDESTVTATQVIKLSGLTLEPPTNA